MGHQTKPDHPQDLAIAATQVLVQPPDQRRHCRCGQSQEKEGMADTPVVGEVRHRIAQRHEDIEVRQRTADSSPEKGFASGARAQRDTAYSGA